MDLEKLENKYKKEQDAIAKKRKRGEFVTKKDDIEAQEDSWVGYLVEKWKITEEASDRIEVVEYFQGKVKSAYVELRDSYFDKKISESEYLEKRKELFTEFEKELAGFGTIVIKTTQKERDVYLKINRDKEIEKENSVATKSLIDRASLCILQTPACEDYFELLNQKNVSIKPSKNVDFF